MLKQMLVLNVSTVLKEDLRRQKKKEREGERGKHLLQAEKIHL